MIFFLLAGIILFPGNRALLAASVDEFKKAAELDSNSVVKRYNLGLAYYKEGSYDAAVETLKQALDTNMEDKASHEKVDFNTCEMIGIIYYNFKNNDDEAIKYFERAIMLNPEDGENYYYAGISYLRKENTDKAIEYLTKSIEKGYQKKADDPSEPYFRLGQAYYKKNVYSDALKWFEKAVEIKPDKLEARELLGLIYHKRENVDKAIENFKVVVKANPENFNVQYLLGLNYFKKKEYDKMIIAYKKAITINQDFADAHFNLGMAYYYRNMYKEAIDELETAKKLNSSDPSTFSLLAQAKSTAYDYYMNQGSTYLTDEDYLKAREQFALALAVRPDDTEAKKYLDNADETIKKQIPDYLGKANDAFAGNRIGDAYNSWYYVLQVDPQNAEAVEGMKKVEKNLGELMAAREKKAAAYLSQEKYNDALDEYRELKKIASKAKADVIEEKIRAVKSKRDNKVKILLAAADKYFAGSGKDFRKAVSKYNEVLKYDEKNEEALDGITKVNQRIESDKEKYLAIAKQNRAGNSAKAVQYYKKVLELDPDNEEANGQIEKLTGSRSRASISAKEIKALYYEGVDKYVNGDIEDAIKKWARVLEMDPNNPEARKNITRAKEKLAAIKSLSR
jgi:tetratricopeptide (TPR) repeat protein